MQILATIQYVNVLGSPSNLHKINKQPEISAEVTPITISSSLHRTHSHTRIIYENSSRTTLLLFLFLFVNLYVYKNRLCFLPSPLSHSLTPSLSLSLSLSLANWRACMNYLYSRRQLVYNVAAIFRGRKKKVAVEPHVSDDKNARLHDPGRF